MIHYHGLPITPETAALEVISAGHAFLNFRDLRQFGVVLEVAQSFAMDNGAFGSWAAGSPVTDWREYYVAVQYAHRLPAFDFAVIPDTIDGGEAANDELVAAWPWRKTAPWVGAPVWHLDEPVDRLVRLASEFPRICLGSSGNYRTVKSSAWWGRMAEAFNAICDRDGRPMCKVHGLRMLDVEVVAAFPFASADSCNVARSVGMDSKWKTGAYRPPTKESRARLMRARIESVNSPSFWQAQAVQMELVEVA